MILRKPKKEMGRWKSLVLVRLLLDSLLGFFCVGNFESYFIMFIEAIPLQSVVGNGGLKYILEIYKAEEVISASASGFFNQPNALEAREWPENI